MTLQRLLWRRTVSNTYRSYSSIASVSGDGKGLTRPVQSYISQSHDPSLNLSIEHYLLQKSHADSAVLFLYVNRPSVIIGRNQNPWSEVNLALLKAAHTRSHAARQSTGTNTAAAPESEPSSLGDVDLVRRRSGGGTVFHDSGNVNWTVISPSGSFTRDKHAEMVVRALRRCGVQRCRVNERHDIVLDRGSADYDGVWGPDEDTHATPWQSLGRAVKVSGSAYKLTRHRALHHGTALLQSPNLNVIPHYLRSPAKKFITGRGVESVSSPVGNIGLSNELFIERVQHEFAGMYGRQSVDVQQVGEEWLGIEQIRDGYEELKSSEWTYLQTPQFTLCNQPLTKTEEQQQPESKAPPCINLTIRNGAITESDIAVDGSRDGIATALSQLLARRSVHEDHDWQKLFHDVGLQTKQAQKLALWLHDMLPPSGNEQR